MKTATHRVPRPLTLRAALISALLCASLTSPAHAQTGCAYDWVAGNPWPSLDDDGPAGLLTWDPDGPGPANPQVVIWGNFSVAGNTPMPDTANNRLNGCVLWDGTAFRPMPGAGAFFGGGAHSGVGTYDPDGDGPLPERLYCVRGNGELQVWNGLEWTTVSNVNPLGVGANYRGIANILQFDPDGTGPRKPLMIIGGAGGVASQGNSRDTMAAYDGTNVFALTPGAGFNGIVYGMTLHDPDGPTGPAKADLIAWGQFTQFNAAAMLQIARFDGTNWHAIGSGLGSGAPPGQLDENVLAVVSFDPDGPGPALPRIYATGQFTTAGSTTVNGRAVWDGVSWQPWAPELNPGGGAMTVADLDGPGPERESIVISGVSGSVGSPTPVQNLAAWNGTSWRSFPDAVTGSPGEWSQRLAVYDPDGAGPLLPRIFQGYGSLGRTFEYDLNTSRYLTTPANLGPHGRVKGMQVYDSDGAGPNPPLLYLASDNARSTSGKSDVNMIAWNGSDYVPLPPNGPCSLETSRTDSPMTVWDRDGPGPLNPILVIATEGCPVSTWNGTAWGYIRDVNNVTFGATNGVTTWDPDGPGPLNPRLILATGFENGLVYQFDAVNYTPMGSVPGEVLDLATWDSNNSGIRKLIVAAGTTIHVWNGSSWDAIPNCPETNYVHDLGVWDRDGAGPSPEVIAAHGETAGLIIWNGTTWENPILPSGEPFYGSQLVGGVDLDGPSGPLPNALLVVNAQVPDNGGGIYLWTGGPDSIHMYPPLGGTECAAVYDPDGTGPAAPQLCIGGSFSSIEGRVSAYFARWDKAVDLWSSPTSGTFNDPSRWECGTAPRPVNSVVFDSVASGYTPGSYTVTLPTGSGAVKAERVRVRTDAVTLNLNGRTFQTTQPGTFIDPALVVGEIANTPASLNITNTAAPADLDLTSLAIGQTRGTSPAVQQLRVQSANARLLVSGDSLIGHRATSSTLALQSGADAVLSGGVSIGDQPSSSGSLTVVGSGTTLLHSAAGESMAVGLQGTGYLQIGGSTAGQAGAIAATIAQMDVLSVGALNGSNGNVVIAGNASLWDVNARTIGIGYAGSGTVDLQAGAHWRTNTSTSLAISAYPGATGLVRLRGTGTHWEEQTAPLHIGNAGTLDVGPGAEFHAPAITVHTGGRLTGAGIIDSTVNRAPIVVTNFGTIDPEPESGPDTGTATLTITGDLIQAAPPNASTAGGIVTFDVAGTAPGQSDQLIVAGEATIGGGFVLKLANGFNPAPGSITNLQLLHAASLTNPEGRFDVAYFPGLPSQIGGAVPYFKLDYSQVERAFSVGVSLGTLQPPDFNDPSTFNVSGGPTSAATGDFNNDGFLDLAVTVPDPVNPTSANGLAVVLLNAGSTGNTWNGFATQISVTVGRNPHGIAVGRFRGPAQPLDIAVANTSGGSVMRLANSGGVSPSFSVASTLTNVGVNPVSLAAADLNADGTIDLAVANAGIVGFDPGNARILTNSGTGTFSNGTILTTGFNPVSIAAARINADNFDDLVTANSESANISVFLRDTTSVTTVAGGTFLPPRTRPTSPRPVEIVPGGLGNPKDLDNDIAVICQPQSSPGSVDIFANRGDGTGELAPSVPLTVGDETSSLALLDMDNDGDTDIAALAAGTGPNTGSRVVRVLRNDSANAGTGQLIFALQPEEIAANSPTLIRAADLNNDGRTDLVTINSTTGTLAARPGEPLPDGRIAQADQSATAHPHAQAKPDRLVNPIAVVRTAAPPPLCPGDFNNDHNVNTADLVIFLARFGTTVPPYTQGDLTGDGTVNTTDLVSFLARFGRPCP